MADWDPANKDDDNNDDEYNPRLMSLEDLENLEHQMDHDTGFDEDDWADCYDDMDSESWEHHYKVDGDISDERDPWDLN